jgi:hypothetical protein
MPGEADIEFVNGMERFGQLYSCLVLIAAGCLGFLAFP